MNRALLELQQLDSSILALSREKKALDDGKRAREQRDEIQTRLQGAQDELKTASSNLRGREGELETTEAKIARQKTRLNASSSAGDVAALERDLVGLAKARGELDEAILELMDASETLQKRVAALGSELLKAEDEVARIEAEHAKSSARLDAQLAQKRALRPSFAGKLSPVESEKYLSAFKNHAGLGVSEAVKGACSACGTTLSRDFLKAAPGETFPQCESCARLIWVAAN